MDQIAESQSGKIVTPWRVMRRIWSCILSASAAVYTSGSSPCTGSCRRTSAHASSRGGPTYTTRKSTSLKAVALEFAQDLNRVTACSRRTWASRVHYRFRNGNRRGQEIQKIRNRVPPGFAAQVTMHRLYGPLGRLLGRKTRPVEVLMLGVDAGVRQIPARPIDPISTSFHVRLDRRPRSILDCLGHVSRAQHVAPGEIGNRPRQFQRPVKGAGTEM